MEVVRVEKTEFELEDGSVHPINPPLTREMSVEEFMRYREKAREVARCLGDVGCHHEDPSGVGQGREDCNCEKRRGAPKDSDVGD
jgi:hypothetical protein